MLKIIVNADDLGKTRGINGAIAECFSSGFVTSTTLMVNMEFADEAVRMAKENGWDDKVGLHLNLTSGRPLTDGIKRFRCFCDDEGCFNAAFAGDIYKRMHFSGQELMAVRSEAKAQIARYLDYGLGNRHLDSHHHVHTDASVWKAMYPLIAGYGIRSVRLTRNLAREITLAKRIYKKRFNDRLRSMPVYTSDYFGSFKDFMECRDMMGDGTTVEIMVHPAHDDQGSTVDILDTLVPVEEEQEYLTGIEHIKGFY